jgi:hypothetical protein
MDGDGEIRETSDEDWRAGKEISELIADVHNSLLGIIGIQRSRVRSTGDPTANMYGYASKSSPTSVLQFPARRTWFQNEHIRQKLC